MGGNGMNDPQTIDPDAYSITLCRYRIADSTRAQTERKGLPRASRVRPFRDGAAQSSRYTACRSLPAWRPDEARGIAHNASRARV